jgi:hypothetical protein
LACWETASFNNNTCQWDVTGSQPSAPTGLACWESSSFNNNTCQWDVTGTQPAQPTLACWETASFNSNTCQWDVTGTPLVATATVSSSISCFGGTGTVTVSVSGGTAPYVGDGVQTVAAGNWNFTVADANGCTVTSNSITVTEPSKVQGSVSVTGATCGNSDGTASVSASGGTGSYSYLWSNGATTSSLSGLVAGTYSVTITDANGCTESASGTVTSSGGSSLAAGSISGSASVCRNVTATYSVAAVTGATSYNWVLPAGATGSSTTNSITVTFGSNYNGGFLCVSPVNSCGSGTPSCLNITVVTVRPSQPGTIAFSGPTCGPTTITCSVAAVSTATSYNWSVSGTGLSILSGQGTTSIQLSIASGFTNGQVGVSATNCVGTSSTRFQTIIGLPTVGGPLSGPLQLCANATQPYSVPSGYGATSYSWAITGNAQVLSSSGTSCIVKTLGNWAGGVLTITAYNSCGSSSKSFTLSAGPGQPGGISGPSSNLCPAAGVTTATYSIAPVTGASSYTWTVPTGMTITANTGTSITVSIGGTFVSGNVCVTANNSCASSVARCLAVTNKTAAPGTISGLASVCRTNTAVSYSISAVTGAMSYTWGATGGATILGSGTSATVNYTGATSSTVTLSVAATNQCGLSNPSKKNISVNLLCRETQPGFTGEALTAFPNPTTGRVTVNFQSSSEDRYSLRVVDLLGKLIYSSDVNAVAGLNVKDIDLSNVAKGVYLLNLQSQAGDSQTLRLIVE